MKCGFCKGSGEASDSTEEQVIVCSACNGMGTHPGAL